MRPCGPGIPSTIAVTLVFVGCGFGYQVFWKYRKEGEGCLHYSTISPGNVNPHIGIPGLLVRLVFCSELLMNGEAGKLVK